jgi:hypothetical protein
MKRKIVIFPTKQTAKVKRKTITSVWTLKPMTAQGFSSIHPGRTATNPSHLGLFPLILSTSSFHISPILINIIAKSTKIDPIMWLS